MKITESARCSSSTILIHANLTSINWIPDKSSRRRKYDSKIEDFLFVGNTENGE